jgi:hypothetical protein
VPQSQLLKFTDTIVVHILIAGPFSCSSEQLSLVQHCRRRYHSSRGASSGPRSFHPSYPPAASDFVRCPSSAMIRSGSTSAASKKPARSGSPLDLVQTLRPPGHFKRPVTPSGESPHTLMIQNMPLGGSLLATTLYDRMCHNEEPALRSPLVYKNELFGRPSLSTGGNFDAMHSEHILRLKPSSAAPGPNRFLLSLLPPQPSLNAHLVSRDSCDMSRCRALEQKNSNHLVHFFHKFAATLRASCLQSKAELSTAHSTNLKSKR